MVGTICYIGNEIITSDDTVISTIKWEGDSRANTTVTRVSAMNGSNNFTYLPLGIGKLFPELTELCFDNVSVKFIKRENFMDMTKLTILNLHEKTETNRNHSRGYFLRFAKAENILYR